MHLCSLRICRICKCANESSTTVALLFAHDDGLTGCCVTTRKEKFKELNVSLINMHFETLLCHEQFGYLVINNCSAG